MRPLRGRQVGLIPQIRQAIQQGHKRIIVQAPCGFGKTVVSAHLIAGCIEKSKRPIFTVPSLSLIQQTIDSFERQGIHDIGVMQSQHERTNREAQTQIASVQTLIRRELPDVHLVLIDECHQEFKKLYEILDSPEWASKVVIGFSATPWKKSMGRRWTHLIVAASIQQMIDEGYQCPVQTYWPKDGYKPDFSKVKMGKNELGENDYDEGQAAQVMSQNALVGNVVDNWIENGPGSHTLLFATNRAHAAKLQEEFLARGVAWGYIDANTEDGERREVFRRYDEGELKGIASVGCLTTGLDRHVLCIILCVKTKSKIKYVQIVGRGMRIAEGKEFLMLFDHSMTSKELGLIETIHRDRLDCSDPNSKEPAYEDEKPPKKPAECHLCHAVMNPGARSCPGCGAMGDFRLDVEEVDGELVLAKIEPKPAKFTMTDKQQFWSELLAIAHEQGRQRGWCSNSYRERHQVWPKGMIDVMKEPSQETRRWVKNKQIRYAKSRAKEAV